MSCIMTLQSTFVIVVSLFAVLSFGVTERQGFNDVTPGGSKPMTSRRMTQSISGSSSQINCPTVCQCDDDEPVGIRVTCKGQGLTGVPKSLYSIATMKLTSYLDLNLNNISGIPSKAFNQFRILKQLHLSGNYLRDIRQNMFSGLKELKELYLQDNKLTTVPANVFSKLPKLTKINLASNFIKSVSDSAFLNADEIAELSLDDNSLSEVPTNAIKSLANLKALDLQINNIREIGEEAFEGQKLEVLLLGHNNIKYIHNDAFLSQKNMLILNLANNDLTEFPRAISQLANLHTLKLSGNQISVIPEHAFTGNPLLTYLTLSDNPIRIIGRTAFMQLAHLETLNLENIHDQKMFPNFDGCKSLTSLSLTGGKISEIPQNICSKLPSLVRLSVAGNQLTNFTGLGKCDNLTTLDVSSNQLTQISVSDMFNLTKLQIIDLSDNKITKMEENVFVGPELLKINLAYNQFTLLPVKGLRALRELNITGVQTMLYLPPKYSIPNLRKLSAFYPYHCCELTSSSRRDSMANSPHELDARNMYPGSYIPQKPVTNMAPFIQCGPIPGPLHPCDNLLPTNALRGFGWITLLVTVVLNVFLLGYFIARAHFARKYRPTANPVQSDTEGATFMGRVFMHDEEFGRSSSFNFVTCNMAVADLAICGYLGILLAYDARTLGEFSVYGAWWQQSPLCHGASFLLVFGTQLAFSSLVIMTLERYLATMHPMDKDKQLRKTALFLTVAASWVFSSVTGTVTLFGGDAYNGKGILPSLSSATCLPWTTEFKYILILISIHIMSCICASSLCLLMLCAKNKPTWQTYTRNTKWQTAFTFGLNTAIILPLGIIALYISVVTTFPSAGNPGQVTSQDKRDIITGNSFVDMESILIFVLLVIPLRCVLNIGLYVIFNKQFRVFLLNMVGIKSHTKHKFLMDSVQYSTEMYRTSHINESPNSYDERHYDTYTESTGYDTSFSQYVEVRNGSHGVQSVLVPSENSFASRHSDVKPPIREYHQSSASKPLYFDDVIEEVDDDASVDAKEEFQQIMCDAGEHMNSIDLLRSYQGIEGVDRPFDQRHPRTSSRNHSRYNTRKNNDSSSTNSSQQRRRTPKLNQPTNHYDLSALNSYSSSSVHSRSKSSSLNRDVVSDSTANDCDENGMYSPVIVAPNDNKNPILGDDSTLTQEQVIEYLPRHRDLEYPRAASGQQSDDKNVIPDRKQRSSESYDSSKDSGIHSEVDSTSVASDAGDVQRVNLIVTSKRQLSTITTPNLTRSYKDHLVDSDRIPLCSSPSNVTLTDKNCNKLGYSNHKLNSKIPIHQHETAI